MIGMTTTPTTLRDLLSNEDYRFLFKRPVHTPRSASDPWAVVAVSRKLKYGKVYRATQAEAWEKAKALMGRSDILDVSMFPRNLLTPPPVWIDDICRPIEDWCSRCRRPTIFFRYKTSHPAMKDLPAVVSGQRRCFYCGINQEFAQTYFKKPA